jgi:hypothetical protein
MKKLNIYSVLTLLLAISFIITACEEAADPTEVPVEPTAPGWKSQLMSQLLSLPPSPSQKGLASS